MKCPDCGFVCSELRDLCPKCLVDMRNFKRSVGLPISHPRASYEQLLARTTGSNVGGSPTMGTSEASGEAQTNSTAFSPLSKFISTFLGFSTLSREATVTPTNQQPASGPEKHAPPSDLIPSQEADLSCPSEGDDPETSIQDLYCSDEPTSPPAAQLAFPTASPEPPEMPSTGPEGTADQDISATPNNPMDASGVSEALLGEGLIEERDDPHFSIRISSSPSENDASAPPFLLVPPIAEEPLAAESSSPATLSEEETKIQPLDSLPEEAMPDVAHLTQAPPAPGSTGLSALSRIEVLDASTLHRHGFELGNIDESIELMFAESLRDLLGDQRPLSVELSAEHFFSMQGREDIEVLFEMSREALIDPESERRYVSTVALSENRTVDAGEATAYLRNLEVLSSTPIVTLKGSGGLSISGRSIFSAEPSQPPLPVPVWRRLVAFSCDCLLGVLLAGCFSLIFLFSGPLSLNEVITGSRVIESFDLIEFTLWSALGFLLLWPSAIALSLAIWSKTFGQWATGTCSLSLRGRKLGVSQSIVWALCLPLALATGGGLMPLLRRATLHEWAARAAVCVNPAPIRLSKPGVS